jgi:PLD-like domain
MPAVDVRLVDGNWSRELATLFQSHPSGLRIICPFVKQEPLWSIVGDSIPTDTRMITRFSLRDFSAGVSDIAAIGDVVEAGGEVRGVKGLHAKVFIFGARSAAVTSANITHNGLHRNAEFGCISGLPDFVEACLAYFDSLWERSQPSVSPAQLAIWAEEVTKFLLTAVPAGSRSTLPDYGAAVDDGESPLPTFDSLASGERPPWIAEATRGHVKFFGLAEERISWSVPVLVEVEGSGSHWACTYPKNRRPRKVWDGDVMFLAAMVEHPDDYLIYGRALGIQYVDGRDDASPADLAVRPWKADYPHYIRIHDAEFVAGQISNGVRLSSLMEALGANAFASTQANLAAGAGNTNPRMALRQHPDVTLSSEGLAWLNERFETSLAQHGRLPAEDLVDLDWPAQSSST